LKGRAKVKRRYATTPAEVLQRAEDFQTGLSRAGLNSSGRYATKLREMTGSPALKGPGPKFNRRCATVLYETTRYPALKGTAKVKRRYATKVTSDDWFPGLERQAKFIRRYATKSPRGIRNAGLEKAGLNSTVATRRYRCGHSRPGLKRPG
jgi:hypothetical protein